MSHHRRSRGGRTGDRAGARAPRPDGSPRHDNGARDARAARPPRAGGRALVIEYVPIDQLRLDPRNPRTISAAELAKLRRSLVNFGCVQPLVVRRSDRRVVAGHQRLLAAKELGLATLPVVFVDLSDPEARALNLALNKVSGTWDTALLAQVLAELQELPGLDETLSGFDHDEIERILSELEREQLPASYEESFKVAAEMRQAQRLSSPTRVQPDEVWRLGRHLLSCGDSLASGHLERVLRSQRVDLVCTDPPYGISFLSGLARPGQRKGPIANDQAEDYEGLLERALPAVKATMKPGAVLYWFAAGGGRQIALAKALLAISAHFTLLNTVVWDKLSPGLGRRWRSSWEAIIEAAVGKPAIWNGGNTQRNVLRYSKIIPGQDEHATPKPVPLLEALIRAAAPSRGLVLDPFLGSGSTLIACERTGRTCVAVELEPRHCDLTLTRWEALSGESATREELVP